MMEQRQRESQNNQVVYSKGNSQTINSQSNSYYYSPGKKLLQLVTMCCLLVVCMLSTYSVSADTVTVTMPLKNKTGLNASEYTIYVVGYATTPAVQLVRKSGTTTCSFQTITEATGNLNTFKLGTDIDSIEVEVDYSNLPAVSAINGARICFFFAENSTYPSAPVIPYTGTGTAVSFPTDSIPPYTFAEYTSPNTGFATNVIDVQTVDGYVAPISVTLDDTGQSTIGQYISDNPEYNRKTILASYPTYIATLGTEAETKPYLDLVYTDNKGGIRNPGTYLTKTDPLPVASSLNTVFDSELNTLFANNQLSIQGVSSGSIAADVYTVTAIGSKTHSGNTLTHPAITLTGTTNKKSYDIFNPVGLNVLTYTDGGVTKAITGNIDIDKKTDDSILKFDPVLPGTTPLAVGMYISGTGMAKAITGELPTISSINNDGSGNIASVTLSDKRPYNATAYQYYFSKFYSKDSNFFFSSGAMVFANAGVFADPNGLTGDDATVVLNLQNQIATALNRGVANMTPSSSDAGYSTKDWGTQTNWYPESKTQNLFSLFMHTDVITAGTEEISLFTLPTGAVKCARGKTMSMAYGFAYDEDAGPVPPAPSGQPSVPAKLQFAQDVKTLTITLGLWDSGTLTKNLTMAVSPDNSGKTNPVVGTHAETLNTNVPITATAESGYTFTKWTVSGAATVKDSTSSSTTVTLTGNATVTANFSNSTDTATLTMASSPDNSGTTSPAAGAHTKIKGTPVTIEATAAAGYAFKNWTVSGGAKVADSSAASTTVSLSGDGTVVANFVESTSTATLTMAVAPASTGETVPAAGAHVETVGAPVTIQATAASGYTFNNWVVSGAATIQSTSSNPTTVTLSGDATVTANFVKNETAATVTMAITPENSGSTNPGVGAHTGHHVGELMAIDATATAGYHFVGWSGSAVTFTDPKKASTSMMIDGTAASATATFAADATAATLTMAANPGAGGSTNPGAGAHSGYSVGEVVSIHAIAAAGYHFTGWSSTTVTLTDPENANTNIRINDARASVTANFEADAVASSLTISVSPDASGNTNPGIGVYTNYHTGEVVPVEASPADGYHFTGWSGSGLVITNSENVKTTVTISEATSTLTANFAVDASAITYTLAVDGNGWTNPGVGDHLLDMGEWKTIHATPAAGSYFVNWCASDNTTFSDPYSETTAVKFDGNAVVTAHFSDIPVTQMTVGSIVNVSAEDVYNAAEVTAAETPSFNSKPHVEVIHDNAVTGKTDQKTKLVVVDKVSKKNPMTKVNAEWNKKVALFNKKDYKSKTEALHQLLLANPISGIQTTSFLVKDKDVSKEFIALQQAVYLAPPFIDNVTGEFSTGGTFTLLGRFFGAGTPKVSVEYYVTDKKENKVYKLKSCKVLKKGEDADGNAYLPYMDAKKKLNKSCMKVYSDDDVYTPRKEVGYSQLSVTYPKLKEDKETITGWVIIENRIGIAAYQVSVPN